MKTIVLGYADKDGKSSPVILAGEDVSESEKLHLVSDAKAQKKFPKGLARVEHGLFQRINTAIEIKKETTSKKD